MTNWSAIPDKDLELFRAAYPGKQQPTPTLADAEANVIDWWQGMDPERKATLKPLKAVQEMWEFIDEPSPEEAADVVIALLAWFWQNRWSLAEYVLRKMAINRRRRWTQLPNGHFQHVESSQ